MLGYVRMAHFSGGQWGRKRRVVGVALFLLCFYGGLISLSCAARLTETRKHAELKKHLKRVNKAPVKSIEVNIGISFTFLISWVNGWFYTFNRE